MASKWVGGGGATLRCYDNDVVVVLLVSELGREEGGREERMGRGGSEGDDTMA